MKKVIILLVMSIATIGLFAQKNEVEVLYFKAQLSCCKAASCNKMENEIKDIIKKNFEGKAVSFRQVPLSDEANKALIEKYNAKSQTVILVSKKKKKETFTDLSDIIQKYSKTKDKVTFEKEIISKINEKLK